MRQNEVASIFLHFIRLANCLVFFLSSSLSRSFFFYVARAVFKESAKLLLKFLLHIVIIQSRM